MALMVSIALIGLLLVIENVYLFVRKLEDRVEGVELELGKGSDWRISGDPDG